MDNPTMSLSGPSGRAARTPAQGDFSAREVRSLTPAQRRVFDDLFAIGSPRPTAPATLAHDLSDFIATETVGAVARWTERSLWLGKSNISTALRCEGQLAADAAQLRSRSIPLATATGIVVHRAIQLAHTHPGRTCDEYIRQSIAGSLTEDHFKEFWTQAAEHTQSDLIVTATSRLVSFMDSVPPLDPNWTPRFEEPISAKIGKVVLAARPDLVLGRPRPDGRQTMFLCDMKSTDIRDGHFDEAMFYALVATLRYGCPPYRSCVLSLTTMDWTDADVTPERLWDAARRVVDAAHRIVDVLTEARGPELLPGRHCTWCPQRNECVAHRAWSEAGSPDDTVPFAVASATRGALSPVATPAGKVLVAAGADDPFAI